MIGLTLTFDYEIYADGTGSIYEHIIKPTEDFLKICESFGAKATLFVDVAELIKMKQRSLFINEVKEVEYQLRNAHENGHDVQLHIHPWWFNAEFSNGKWSMDYNMSTLCHLHSDTISKYIQSSKQYLIDVLEPCVRKYSCIAFRAGAWSMMPTKNMHNAMVSEGIEIDSSVFKWGKAHTPYMTYDYSDAFSNIYPWFFSSHNINYKTENAKKTSSCIEIPIYSEYQRGFRFLTKKRFSLMSHIKSTVVNAKSANINRSLLSIINDKIRLLIKKRAKKLDFCKCKFSEMKKMIENIMEHNPPDGYLPIVAIGHSKDFIYRDDFSRFLLFLRSNYTDTLEVVPLTTAAKKYRDLNEIT